MSDRTTHSWRPRTGALVLLACALPAVLAACSSTPQPPAPSAPKTTALKTGSVSQGKVIVDSSGMTVYIYTVDTKGSGKSSCTGGCLQAWPMITSKSATVTGTGITAKIGTIPAPNGGHQVTVDGWPIYTYAHDKAPGDSSGQGVGGVWYMLKPDGTQVGAQSGSGSGSGYGY